MIKHTSRKSDNCQTWVEITRLPFAMAVHLEPEIILVDVVLAMKDATC
jgi:hypothetical protein